MVVAAVVVAAVAAVPGLAGIRQRLAHADPAWLMIGGAAQLAAGISYVALFRCVFSERMRWTLSLQIGLSELAADALLPGGGTDGLALGAWALHRGGMSTGHIARRSVVFFLATSAANFALVILAGLGLALGVLPGKASLALGGARAGCWQPPRARARIHHERIRRTRRRCQGDRVAAALGPTAG